MSSDGSRPHGPQIRQPLLDADSGGVLALLMRFPAMEDVTPLIEYADLLRR